MQTITLNESEPWEYLKFDGSGTHSDYDAIEIGALDGETTKVLARNFKRVFVIDPWDGRQQGVVQKYDIWKNNTKEFKNVFHARTGSETQEARNFLNNIKDWNLGFVYVDGLHTAEAVVNDINLVFPYSNNKTKIMVDDVEYPPVRIGCNQAFIQLAPKILFEKIIKSFLHPRIKWIYGVNN